MTKHGNTPSRTRPRASASPARSDPAGYDDRPFADIRRTTHDVIRLLSLRRWAFFIPFTFVTCAAFVVSLYYPRTYRATTSFERRNDPVMMNLPMSAGAASFKFFRNTMVRDLRSLGYMREVVDNLGLMKDAERDEHGELTEASQRRRDALAGSLGSTITVSTVSPSEQIDIIKITYTGPDPNIGKRLVDEVKKTYTRQTMTWIHDYLTDQRDYFKSEAEEEKEKVKEAKRNDTRFRLENPHLDPRNPGAVALKLEQLERDRKEMLLRQRGYKEDLSALEQTLTAIAPHTVTASQIQPVEEPVAGQDPVAEQEPVDTMSAGMALRLAARMSEIDREVQQLRATRGMTDLHPDIQSLLKERAWLTSEFEQHTPGERRLAQRVDGPRLVSLSPVPDSPLSERAWVTERARLLVQISAQRAKLNDIEISLGTNATAIEDMRLTRGEIYEKQEEFAGVSNAVRTAKQTLTKLQLTLALIEPAIKAVEQNRLLQFSEGQPDRGSIVPVTPRSSTVIFLSLMAGLAAGIIFVVLAEVFDQVLRSSSHVARALGLPMLETIDEIVTSVDRRRLFVRRVVVTPLVVSCFAGVTVLSGSLAYLSLEKPRTYQRMSRVPRAVLGLFAGDAQPAQATDANPIS